jgi:hypothetical protein
VLVLGSAIASTITTAARLEAVAVLERSQHVTQKDEFDASRRDRGGDQ